MVKNVSVPGGLMPSFKAPDEPESKPPELEAESVRGPVRESAEESLARAAKRAAEIRGNLGEAGLDDGVDEFHVDKAIIPEGWSYEWKMQSVLGKEDPSYQVALAHKGWDFVPTRRHPQLMPFGTPGHMPITRKGMALMERPKELTDEARAIEKRRAREQVRAKEEQLNAAPPGTFDRSNKGDPMTKMSRSYEPLPVPKDAA